MTKLALLLALAVLLVVAFMGAVAQLAQGQRPRLLPA
jgi:hypothetical protein